MEELKIEELVQLILSAKTLEELQERLTDKRSQPLPVEGVENLRTPFRTRQHITVVVEGDDCICKEVETALRDIRAAHNKEVSFTFSRMPKFSMKFLD